MGFEDGPCAIKYYDAKTRNIQVSRNYRFPQSQIAVSADPSSSLMPKEAEAWSLSHTCGPMDQASHTDASLNKRPQSNDPLDSPQCSTRQKVIHDYKLLNDPWAQEPPDKMTSAEMVYLTFNETKLAPEFPKSLQEAKESPDWPDWEKAVHTELEQLQKMGTWNLVDPPPDVKPIPNKWVLVKKYDKEGNLQKYKARLVAKGYSQIPGMHYHDTFAPVVRMETIRVLLALSVQENWEVQQMDVKGAFLNGNITEDIYMKQPESYDDGMGCLCHLIKSLYGLKQAGRA